MFNYYNQNEQQCNKILQQLLLLLLLLHKISLNPRDGRESE